jgi:hypothetical protein
MRTSLCALALLAFSVGVRADEPTLKVGATIFADAVWQAAPVTTDADGNEIHPSSFNVARAYINVTGTLHKRLAFRITPDVARESGGGSSLAGSQQFRLKYAYAQLNLDEWLTGGSFVRFGMQQTPYLDYVDSIYRYRFQGTTFVEREGYLASSDTGVTMRYVLPSEYGDVHGGIYNGEGYTKAETNDQKALQLRATLRPLPKSKLGKGLRATLFYDGDRYVANGLRERLVGQLAYEHPRVNAGLDVLSTKDRVSASKPQTEGRGWSVFATPRLGRGWELLLRHDHNRPDRGSSVERTRNIAGVAYWLPNLQKVTAGVLVDRDALSVTGKADETRYGVKVLLVF